MDIKQLYEMGSWDWPEGTGPLLLEVLNNRLAQPGERLIAAEMAGDFVVIDDRIAASLLTITCSSDEDAELRERAVIALGPALEHADLYEFDQPEDIVLSKEMFQLVQTALAKLYLDPSVPKGVRRRILEASIRAPQSWHEAAVRAAYASGDEDWQLTAVFCMKYLEGFDSEVLAALASRNPDIHYEAVCAAGDWELLEAWPHIEQLLTTHELDKYLLMAAIEAAASINHPEAAELIENYISADDEDVAETAYEALSMMEARDEDFLGEDWDAEEEEEDDSFRHKRNQ